MELSSRWFHKYIWNRYFPEKQDDTNIKYSSPLLNIYARNIHHISTSVPFVKLCMAISSYWYRYGYFQTRDKHSHPQHTTMTNIDTWEARISPDETWDMFTRTTDFGVGLNHCNITPCWAHRPLFTLILAQ